MNKEIKLRSRGSKVERLLSMIRCLRNEVRQMAFRDRTKSLTQIPEDHLGVSSIRFVSGSSTPIYLYSHVRDRKDHAKAFWNLSSGKKKRSFLRRSKKSKGTVIPILRFP